jgi:transposase-like protein
MKKKGTKRKYSSKLMAQIVYEYEHTTDVGLRDLEKKYGVKYGTIYSWVKKERDRRSHAKVPKED